MAVKNQTITKEYALYNGDCVDVLKTMPADSVHLSVYSPPFCGLYNYSSDDRDMSNCATYEEFYQHYEYLVQELARVTRPGRMSCVHCMDIPVPGQKDGYHDLPGEIIKIHERNGFFYFGRVTIWKEPLRVAIRTRLKHLTHKQLVKDSTECTIAAGDFLLIFRKRGENTIPVTHEIGFNRYYGTRKVPDGLEKYKGETTQKENKLSHWIWRQYASCIWDDIAMTNPKEGDSYPLAFLPYMEARDPDDEKHCHPLQQHVISRCIEMWSNPGEVVLTPFMGVGSEVYGAVLHNRKGIGIELKETYYNQSLKNVPLGIQHRIEGDTNLLFADEDLEEEKEFDSDVE
jgi:DNA modification methylase